MFENQTIFQFKDINPHTLLIIGGMIALFIGLLFHSITPGSGGPFLIIGFLILLLGVILYLIWLDNR